MKIRTNFIRKKLKLPIIFETAKGKKTADFHSTKVLNNCATTNHMFRFSVIHIDVGFLPWSTGGGRCMLDRDSGHISIRLELAAAHQQIPAEIDGENEGNIHSLACPSHLSCPHQ